MSQNARELYSRFSHLLQPIRDLTKNWNVDVASQLEEYIEEIEQITISFDGGTSSMNFAEAALLIQGSTCVYSKKVEYLYGLVYQTLDLIASKRKLAQQSSVDDQGKDRDISFVQTNDSDEFLTLDMVESTNIDMDESKLRQMKKATIVPRTPMSLIPLQDVERASSTPLLSKAGEILGSRVDFKMNTSVVGPNGVLLLEPDKQLVLNVKMVNSKEPIPITFDTPQEKIQEMLETSIPSPIPFQFEEDGGGAYDDYCVADSSGGAEGEMMGEAVTTQHKQAADHVTRKPSRVCLQEEQSEDPWTLLDPHAKGQNKENRPFKKGHTYKIPHSLVESKNRKRKKGSRHSGSALTEPLSTFMHRSVYSCSSMFPKNLLKAPQSSEFEGHYWAELKKRLKQKRQDNIKLIQMRKEHALQLEQEAQQEEEEDNVEDYQPLGNDDPEALYGGGVESGFEGAFDNYATNARDPHTNLMAMAADAGQEAAFQGVEPMALDELSGRNAEAKQLNYEDLVKNYVEGTMEGVQAYMEETELSKRVQQWEDRIRPLLVIEEQYPVFDIHAYSSRFIGEFQDHERNADCSGPILFRDLMNSKSHHEVARMFAATLQMANDRNIEIVYNGCDKESVDSMALTLLNPQLPHSSISGYKAPSLHTQQL